MPANPLLRGALSINRINTIMRSSSEAETIAKESPSVMSKAAELFIKLLAKEGYKLSNNGKKLDYKHLAEVVNGDERYEFLRDIIPKKITYAEFKRMQGRAGGDDSSSGTDDDDDSSDESSSESQ